MLSDDQRADTIAALGNRHIRTPNLDRLVRRGTVFTSAYCMGSLQGAVCVPSRAMLLAAARCFVSTKNSKGQSTWPDSFAKAGYTTFLTGKWHNQAESALRLFGLGKSIFLGGMGDPYNLPLVDISPQHTLVDREPSGAHSVKLFADAAITFLRNQTGDSPFLCFVAFNAPHDPRTAPTVLSQWYYAHYPPLPPNFLTQHPFDNGEMAIRDERLRPGRGPRNSYAGTWQTITPPLSSSMNRSDASRGARCERPTPKHAHRIHQRSRPGDRQPWAFWQAESLRTLDEFAAHHCGARCPARKEDRGIMLSA